jgi:undecaprenyl-diphosphatase
VGVGVAVVVVVGLTRIALGVHFVSDVLGGWLVGSAWLLVTATAVRAGRRHDGWAVGSAVDGLAPEIAADLTPESAATRAPAHRWTTAAQLLVGAVLLTGALVGIGLLLVHQPPGSALVRFDVGVVAWLAEHRIPALDTASAAVAELGDTGVVVGGGALAALVAYGVTRRPRPALVIVVVLLGEVLIFLTASAVVGRSRPPVDHLDATLPPTSSFPSGHTAAALCLYGAVAALVLRGVRAWWRWAVLGAAVLVVVAVALARLYRGAHHPTDVLGSVLFALPWLLLTLRLVGDDDAPRRSELEEGVPGRR